jgi:hypothetical protein
MTKADSIHVTIELRKRNMRSAALPSRFPSFAAAGWRLVKKFLSEQPAHTD